MTDYSKSRVNMVNGQIHTFGVVSADILESFRSTPREEFLPKDKQPLAYADEDIIIDDAHFLLEPAVHAKMIQSVNPQEDDVALDIGVGTGYSSAILSPLVTTVVALEPCQGFLDKATRLWDEQGLCNIVGMKGSLAKGDPANAPFSLIILNGAVSEIPEGLVQQLSPEGRLITIVKKAGDVVGQVTLVQKTNNNNFTSYPLFDASSPYLSEYEPKLDFQF